MNVIAKNLAIYGAGNKMLDVWSLLQNYLPDIHCVYAVEGKDKSKIGTELVSRDNPQNKCEVISVEKLMQYYKENRVDAVVFPSTYGLFDWNEIEHICKSVGIADESILTIPYDYLKSSTAVRIDEILVPYRKISQIFHLDIHVTDKCNLKCKGCAHFSPLCDNEWMLNVGEYDKYLKRLKELIPYVCDISLLGGEPLLHPQISSVIEITRKYYKHANIQLNTNGILLPQMDDSLIQNLIKNNISIVISVYPPFAKHIEEQASRHAELNFHLLHCEKFERRLSAAPVYDGNETTKLCGHVLCMKNEYIARCPEMMFAQYFNRAFGDRGGINLPEEKGVNIFEVDSGLELIQGLNKPKELCSYCCGRDLYYENWEMCGETINPGDFLVSEIYH